MNFLCRCCKSRVEKKKPFEFMADAGLHKTAYHMEWVLFDERDSDKPVNERQWLDFDDTPEVGKTYIMRVKKPFDEDIGGIFTNIFEPAMMAANGWDSAETPEDICKPAAVLCRFREVLWADDFSAFIHIEVLNVVMLADLHKVLPVTLSDAPAELFGEVEEVWTEYEDEHWLIRTWTGQGDVGAAQFLYTDDSGTAHEVITSWYDFHDDTYCLGNRVGRVRTGFENGDVKRYVRLISEPLGYGMGYIDKLFRERMYFAFFRNEDGKYTSVVISGSDWFHIEKEFPIGASDSAEKLQEFREKYIRKKKIIMWDSDELPQENLNTR